MKKKFHDIDYLVLLRICCKKESNESFLDRDSTTLQATAAFSGSNVVNVAKIQISKLLLYNFIKEDGISFYIFSKVTQRPKITVNLLYAQLGHYCDIDVVSFIGLNRKTKFKYPKFRNRYFKYAKISYIFSRN